MLNRRDAMIVEINSLADSQARDRLSSMHKAIMLSGIVGSRSLSAFAVYTVPLISYNVPITTLFAHPLQLHLSEEYFPQADKYIPERWIPDESPFPPVQDFTYYPFSAGSRNCIGKNLAMMELRLVLAALILTYDMELVPNQREDCVQYLTPSLATGSYIIKMKRRHGAQSTSNTLFALLQTLFDTLLQLQQAEQSIKVSRSLNNIDMTFQEYILDYHDYLNDD
ncbi:hypothetical protein BX616_008390, partial [Lobosporangium transversale]